ncbi:MAG: hypothetical protein HRT90_12070 [Candidatus Margulisbacteria bacterium]|nr:hypothetical protein [Candidatus Margulisiibacteriota bacterium]
MNDDFVKEISCSLRGIDSQLAGVITQIKVLNERTKELSENFSKRMD